ncbi:hypothetical protein HH800_15630 [Sphingobium yanoikuyae]|uniref:Uncharacterized protein n=1 Tax=Sphingobium yanoikuyae TaxID=13690 RepID=A0A6M4G856_SPHYA|nr:hypothetical protein [Sphingobium yanoikuyae]QJR03482.1 hypothetical protein HH800_15630 [Sphingobium yanoikuyae]
MTVKFLRDFDYRETDYKTIAYLAGYAGEVDYECAIRAVEAGAAELDDPHEMLPPIGEQEDA